MKVETPLSNLHVHRDSTLRATVLGEGGAARLVVARTHESCR